MKARVVLVGAGHAHVLLLKSWAGSPLPDADVTIVNDGAEATYSGMVPGCIAGDYRPEEARIAVEPLAAAAGARLLVASARRIDAERRIIELSDGNTLGWDIASLDVGSSVQGLEIPGAREHAIATRPVDGFLDEIDGPLAAGLGPRVVVVGAGAAGVELAFTLHARLAGSGADPKIVVVCGPDGVLSSYPPSVRRAVQREADAKRIDVVTTAPLRSVDAGGVAFDGGRIDADLVVWATGAAPPALIADSALPQDERGYVRVKPTLQVEGFPTLFAAGDCASIEGAEDAAKAGVHAVRAAPILEANLRATLRAALHENSLRQFRPQRHFLSLINLGGRRALASKWGLVFRGHLAWLLKDRIDRAFVEGLRPPPQPGDGDAAAHRPDRKPGPR